MSILYSSLLSSYVDHISSISLSKCLVDVISDLALQCLKDPWTRAAVFSISTALQYPTGRAES